MTLVFFTYNSPEYTQALALRDKILRQPLHLKFTEEELAKDKNDVHLGLFRGADLVACLSLTDAGERMKMRQVAVDEQQQRKGYGKQIASAAEQYAVRQGKKIIYCHARETAVPFYLQLGYAVVGERFTEITIPHYQMEKKLTPFHE